MESTTTQQEETERTEIKLANSISFVCSCLLFNGKSNPSVNDGGATLLRSFSSMALARQEPRPTSATLTEGIPARRVSAFRRFALIGSERRAQIDAMADFRKTDETFTSGASTLPQRYFVSQDVFAAEREHQTGDNGAKGERQMPTEVFQLKTLTRVLADDVELSEALGIAEVSALATRNGSGARRCRRRPESSCCCPC